MHVIVVGSGLAGLLTALRLARASTIQESCAAARASTVQEITLLTAGSLGSGASPWAQGGVSAAVGDDAINRCIQGLRRLGAARGGFSILTVPRVGYRLDEGEDHRRFAAPEGAGLGVHGSSRHFTRTMSPGWMSPGLVRYLAFSGNARRALSVSPCAAANDCTAAMAAGWP